MKKKKSLEVKIRKAKERTRQWALGVNIDFPEMPDSEEGGEKEARFGFSPKNERHRWGQERFKKER